MKYTLSKDVFAELQKISKKNHRLSEKIKKQLRLFEKNSQHPSLRIHKLQGNLEQVWSISIDRKTRMIYRLIKKGKEKRAFFYDIGTHDEVYGKT